MRVDITQRDQFNNDDVDLAEALVRESIQNSTDAAPNSSTQPVKVRLAIKELDEAQSTILRDCIVSLHPHFEACGLDYSALEEGGVRVLSIEDFNTTGLTGSFEQLDKDNFENFWRKIGKSEKRKGKLGRWGLGKLVYPSSSRASLFFGLTIREGEQIPSALGQVVLANHRINDAFFPTHGFWFSGRSTNELKLQLPTSDGGDLRFLRTIADIRRTTEAGFSVVIPYLIPSVTEESLIEGVLSNYYFPILSGALEVEVGDKLIDAESFLEIAEQFGFKSHRTPFDFILGVSERLEAGATFSTSIPVTAQPLADQELDEAQVTEMKERFAKGEIVHFKAPVELVPQKGAKTTGYMDLFLQQLHEGEAPYSLFARGAITLPGERHFSGVARAAMIVRDTELGGLLGDAENPAHTAWNQNARLLNERWQSGKNVLSAVRHSLQELFGRIAEQSEQDDNDALIDFFSIVDQAEKAAKKKKKKTVKPKPDVPAALAALRIHPNEGGFEIKAGPGSESWTFPRVIRVKMAYDMIGANPFKKHSKFDFDLQKDKTILFKASNAICEPINTNTLKVVATGPKFEVDVSGFDSNRDLLVDVRAL